MTSPKEPAADGRALILASASPYRARLLSNAGVAAEVCPASVDEAAIKHSMQREGVDPADIARALAEVKAQRVMLLSPTTLKVTNGRALTLVVHCKNYDLLNPPS